MGRFEKFQGPKEPVGKSVNWSRVPVLVLSGLFILAVIVLCGGNFGMVSVL